EASRRLDTLAATPAVVIDRMAAAMLAGQPGETIALYDELPEPDRADGPAMWNRGLALAALGLSTTAADTFDRVAALGERGWANEAKERAQVLRRNSDARRQGWRAARRAGQDMVVGGPPVEPHIARRFSGITRLLFNHALRTAGDRERVRALAPLAAVLDGATGGTALQQTVERLLSGDFAGRARFAGDYQKLFEQVNLRRGPGTDVAALLAQARAMNHPDLLVATFVLADQVTGNLDEFDRLAGSLGDPWWIALGRQFAISALVAHGELLEAEQRLLAAIPDCHQLGVPYRCAYLEDALINVYNHLNRPTEAARVGGEGLQHASAAGEWGIEAMFLQDLARAARSFGRYSLARAYLYEERARERDSDAQEQAQYCVVDQNIEVQLGLIALEQHDPVEADRRLHAAPACDGPASVSALDAFTELPRWPEVAVDLAWIRQQIEARRRETQMPGLRARLDAIEGRLAMWQDPQTPSPLLRQAIAQADARPAWDLEAHTARATAYATLALAQARRGAWKELIKTVAEQSGVAAPQACVLAVSLDRNELLVAMQDAVGVATGQLRAVRGAELDAAAMVSKLVGSSLAGCPVVDVLARPPFQGSAELLPPTTAWRFRVSRTQPPPTVPTDRPRRRLVVAVSNPGRGLPALAPFRAPDPTPGEELVVLESTLATASRVLTEMDDASEIDFYAHGIVDIEVSDVSFLALSPDVDGTYALTAGEVRKRKLRNAPLIVLESCHAALPAPYRHAPWSLPVAFIDAGASSVLASLSPVVDREATPFYRDFTEAVRSGVEPAIALRDARVRAIQQHRDSSVKGVVLFQ
ncbi:MAG: CHAT domain-containing protein, partial [Kofleriaceae bacterium]